MEIKEQKDLDSYQVVKGTVSKGSILDIMFTKELMTRKLFSFYDRGEIMQEKAFENPPHYIKHAYSTGKETNLYKIRGGSTVNFEHVAKECGIPYETISADIYLIPHEYKHLGYKKVEQKILDVIFPGCTTYNNVPFYYKWGDHNIYLDPAIIFDASKRTKDYVIEFFKRYNHRDSTNLAIEYLQNNWDQFQEILNSIQESKVLILDKIEKENKSTTILMHRIEYRYSDNEDLELTETDIEHIEEQIKNECNQGELCTSTGKEEFYGRWKIVKD